MTSRPAPWEQQPGETAVAFAAFACYRDLGAFRSLSKVAKELGKSKRLMERWSVEHSWTLRVNAWDAEMDRLDRLEVIEARRQMRKRHVELAKDFQEKLVARLEEMDPDTIRSQLADPVAMVRWLDVATKVERAALGEPDRVEIAKPGSHAADDADLEALSDEQIRQRMAQIKAEIDAELGEYDEAMSLRDQLVPDRGEDDEP